MSTRSKRSVAFPTTATIRESTGFSNFSFTIRSWSSEQQLCCKTVGWWRGISSRTNLTSLTFCSSWWTTIFRELIFCTWEMQSFAGKRPRKTKLLMWAVCASYVLNVVSSSLTDRIYCFSEDVNSASVDDLLDLTNFQLPPTQRRFVIEKLSNNLLLPKTVERISNVELELDGVAADILNNNDIKQQSASASSGMFNPPLDFTDRTHFINLVF